MLRQAGRLLQQAQKDVGLKSIGRIYAIESTLGGHIVSKEATQANLDSSWFVRACQGQLGGFHSSSASCIQSNGAPPNSEASDSAGPSQDREAQQEEAADQDPYAKLSLEDLHKLLIERDQSLSVSLAQAEEKTDLLKRALADMENLRQRSARQAENTKKFAVQGFLKSMLDVGDNLERAYEAVPKEALKGLSKDGQPLQAEAAVKLLNGLVNGVKLTERIFEQGLKENSVEKYRPLGAKFDPNLHEALFEIPDPSSEPGTIGAVTKTGYLLQGRVVRPAQVGVIKAP